MAESSINQNQIEKQYKKEKQVYDKQYRQEHKKEIAEYYKQYQLDNKKKIAIHKKQYRQAHKKERAEYNRQYEKEHKKELALRRKLYRQTKQGKMSGRKANHKRRALKMGVGYENFNPNEIFERDRYICQHCGKKTRPDYKNIRHPLYPNLDHIVPLSKGGTHTRINTQCLCYQCNVRKYNNNYNDQLRMFV